MTRQYFGTDGIRGKVGKAPITPDFVMRLGYAAGKVLATKVSGGDRPAVLIGKDTRVSGYMLESALEAGLSAAGVDVLLVGPMPTPAVAYLTRALRLSAGIVISASHNPYDDNGIKFFSGDGAKLPDEVESSIERQIGEPFVCMPSARLGKVKRIDDAAGRYIEFCKSTFPNHLDLRGLKIVVDCAHGAGYHIAPHVFHELGADVLPIGVDPDGFNINDLFGATSPQALQMEVRKRKADLGLALDGDGDRLVMVDGTGKLYDGDQLLYVIARHARERGELRGGVAGTLMSNLAFEQALAKLDIPFARARVGDRYVLELLNERGWQIGGENSGHIICLDKHTTGDAIVAALQVLRVLAETKTTLDEVCKPVALFPQVLINVDIGRRGDLAKNPAVRHAIDAAEHNLAGSGRVLLRPSGTEPVVRVMVEAKARAKAERWAKTIAEAGTRRGLIRTTQGKNMRIVLATVLLLITGWLAGCEGVVTGTEVARVALQTGADGAYTPVRFNLAPDMNPVAVNFRADFSQNPAEFDKYNTYRATLSKDGSVAAMRTININHLVANPQGSAPPPTQTIYTLFYVDVQSASEHELTITPVKPVEISLSNAQIDARRNVQRPPQ